MNNLDEQARSVIGARILWPAPPAHWDAHLKAAQPLVHVWAAGLDAGRRAVAAYRATLSDAELERAGRFRFELHRDRFVVGRGFLRAVLSRYLQAKPKALEFGYGPQGKPFLTGAHARSGWHFNLTHAEDLALVAVASTGQVGVDVEMVRSMPDAAELVARFFSARESVAFRKLPNAIQRVAFFNLWTRKEAWLKATGEGLGDCLSSIEVSFVPGEPACVVSLPSGWHVPEGWLLHELGPAPGFIGALAVTPPAVETQCWRWSE